MIYYLMIFVAVCLFSTQFLLNNEYRKECGNTWNSVLKFSFYSSITGFITLVITNKFNFNISMFSAVVAGVYSLVCIGLSYSSIKAFTYANLSVYSVFAMIGGMLLPFIYGLMCGEEFKIIRIVCCILIALCVSLAIERQKQSKKAVKYYIAVFVLNGMAGVISKFHQSYTELCVDSGSFMIMTRIFTFIICVVLLLLQQKKNFSITKKAAVYSMLYSVVNGIGNLLLLIALLHIPASVQYPIVTGGTIVVSTIISLIKRDRITKKEILAAGIAFVATCFMAI